MFRGSVQNAGNLTSYSVSWVFGERGTDGLCDWLEMDLARVWYIRLRPKIYITNMEQIRTDDLRTGVSNIRDGSRM